MQLYALEVSGYVALYRLVVGYKQLLTSNIYIYLNIGNKITKKFAFNKNLMFAHMKNSKKNYIP